MHNEICQCGRATHPKHCPFCGSLFVYIRNKSGRVEVVTDTITGDKTQIRVKGFACRRCGEFFADDVPCTAESKQQAPSRAEAQAARAALKRGANASIPTNSEERAALLYQLALRNPMVRERQESQGVDFGLSPAEAQAQIQVILEGGTLLPSSGVDFDGESSDSIDTHTQTDATQPQILPDGRLPGESRLERNARMRAAGIQPYGDNGGIEMARRAALDTNTDTTDTSTSTNKTTPRISGAARGLYTGGVLEELEHDKDKNK
jgi:hypothetical protein